MLIAAVLCLCAAAASAGVGAWSLTRPHSTDTVPRVLRSVAPIQLATAAMLAAGGAVALVAPRSTSLTVLIVCVLGAVGTLAAGCYQGAKAGAAMMGLDNAPASDGCAGSCASCTLSCS
ncbi:hypothetical protein FZI85_13810 [Mycobacterium sp. CBMA293]|uniref:hypothetical protein n=1 Tax=unclassified Mycolicibacterium TaxID=2636767 RepID=UPI0012DDF86D|nr:MULTISPECIES: hypothetical protein [unclassified Mycolicibacterium]MUL50042.1 hypothetical protein [Mycolicibacterium sp. CBMA 360]MUL59607.1 hypothetical protein [Mycolicibacterium sp. CBMA 335]MUL67034.1 hypothetical protein [Mycolicibacterium sp. CBMA 234]MUL71332.1 hypothetical protein [Mycolicibacterium sp. CBMA 311]MUL94975.1 hypothetical protein [Mycolicibacterium sp. CBMA 230]